MHAKDANINLQMSYWSAETTNLDVSQSLFDYMEVCAHLSLYCVTFIFHSSPDLQKTWAPRGAYTAEVLYSITRGWVTHDEVLG